MKLKLFPLTALVILLFPVATLATSFSVRLGQPKSPTRQDNFKLTFVALDTKSVENITVKCFKKGPSDGDFVQFDGDKVLIPGGNTDYCQVNSSILNTNGTYSFKVTATKGDTTLTSSTVNVDYSTVSPSAPSDYSKEKLNDCDYRIKFKTADDGRTTKVQLFRSDTLNISVNGSSVISTLNIGPNQEGQITNSVPVCGKEYYYVIRAVDSADNVSGTVGDSFTTTTTTTTTTGTVEGSTGSTGAIALRDGSTQVVPTEAGTDSASGDISEIRDLTSENSAPTPSILGTSTDSKRDFLKWLVAIALVIAGYYISKSFRKTKSK